MIEVLAPSSVVVYLMQAEGHFEATSGNLPAGLERLPRDLPTGRGWSEELDQAGGALAHAPVRTLLAAIEPDQLVPIPDRSDRLVGLLVLGRNSKLGADQEEGRRALASIATHAGIALEIIQLAEQLAERMDGERRSERELGIARDVQRRLFPQSVPELPSLEIAARCVQARSVGGDYYDFLDLGPDQTGFVLADVSGKGMAAALRMANLQAHLRSQIASAPRDPLRVLRQVNRMLLESTDPGHFATLFLGVYTESSRRLSYINCGHNPPLCVRRDGSIEWLHATATVLGSFEQWECTLGRTQLAAGDVLVAYSDGVTEAGAGEHLFGEERLAETVREHAALTCEAIVDALLARVEKHAQGLALDDLTLLVTRGRDVPLGDIH